MNLKARPNASAHQIKNIKQWLSNAQEPIDPSELSFLRVDNEEELTPVFHRERTPLRRLIDGSGLMSAPSFFKQRKVRFPMTGDQN